MQELKNAFASRDIAHWRAAFAGWDAPWEVIQTIREVANDPQAVANDYLFKVKVTDGTAVTVVAGPVSFNGSAAPAQPRCAPQLGQDTDDLLQGIHISRDAIKELKRRKIVA